MCTVHVDKLNVFVWIWSSKYRTAGLARARDGSISWMDESALDFENWADGEPNSVEGDGEDCVQMYTQVEAV